MTVRAPGRRPRACATGAIFRTPFCAKTAICAKFAQKGASNLALRAQATNPSSAVGTADSEVESNALTWRNKPMPTVEKETVVAPADAGGGVATALIALLALAVVAVVGYFIYANYSGNNSAPTIIEHNTTVQPPSMPAPSAPSMPSAPSTDK